MVLLMNHAPDAGGALELGLRNGLQPRFVPTAQKLAWLRGAPAMRRLFAKARAWLGVPMPGVIARAGLPKALSAEVVL
jgi:hypothetical protein